MIHKQAHSTSYVHTELLYIQAIHNLVFLARKASIPGKYSKYLQNLSK